MNRAIVGDMLRGFLGQLRRSPWGVLLLWLGLCMATVALTIGFSLAASVSSSTMGTLPGELDRLQYATVSTVARPGDATPPSVWQGFQTDMLDRLLAEGVVDGYFFQIRGRPVRFVSKATGQTTELLAELTVYAGRVPLFQGRATDALTKGSSVGGVTINRSFGADVGLGDAILMGPGDSHPVTAVVGPPSGLDPAPKLMLSSDRIHGAADAAVAGLYLADHRQPAELERSLTALVHETHSGTVIRLTSGQVEHRSTIREALMVSAMAVGISLLVALVAFVNTGSFVMVWVLNRAPGLALRRALGATPRLIVLYILGDLILLLLTALVGGYLVLGGAWAVWLRPRQLTMISIPGLLSALLVMVAATGIIGLIMVRAAIRKDPGAFLGRAL